MPLESISISRLQLIYPTLADLITRMADILDQEAIQFRVVQALRSWTEQDMLYAQGRTTPGKIVTNCRGGYSYHNFGLAVDLVPAVVPPVPGDNSVYIPDWNSSHPTWARMEAVGVSLGMTSGATWRTFPDAPHFQITGRFPEGSPDDEVRQLFRDGGMQAVWAAVGG